MRILVTGGTGVIGYKLVKLLVNKGEDVHYTFLANNVGIPEAVAHKLDVKDSGAVIDFIKNIKPDLTFHTIALTKVDLCETNHQLADAINIQGTRNVVDACKQVDSKIVFVSTSAVFDGKKQVYYEQDARNPQYYYAFTKAEGEKIVENSGLGFLILRTDQPYCWVEKWQHDNSVLRVLNKLKAGEVMKDVIDWYSNPTLVDNFVEVAYALIKKNKNGIYHVIGSDFLNRYEMALKVAEVFSLDKNLVQPMKSADLNLPAKRVNVNMNNEKAQKDSGIKLLNFEESLIKMRNQI